MSQLPYFLSDFHHFCTNLFANFYSFFWNYGNSGLDFPFKDRWNTGPARTDASRRAGAEIADLS